MNSEKKQRNYSKPLTDVEDNNYLMLATLDRMK